MSTMKRFRPKRSFSTAVGGPGAARREAALVFGAKSATTTRDGGPMVALPGATRVPARVPVRFDLPSASLEAMRGAPGQAPGVAMEKDDSLPAGTMRVTYADGTTELMPVPKR